MCIQLRSGDHAKVAGAALGHCIAAILSTKRRRCLSWFAGLAMLAAPARAARPWTMPFGTWCTFSGDYDGAPVTRAGTCPAATDGLAYLLDLNNKGITAVPAETFDDVGVT